jgi:hypothetical protein
MVGGRAKEITRGGGGGGSGGGGGQQRGAQHDTREIKKTCAIQLLVVSE